MIKRLLFCGLIGGVVGTISHLLGIPPAIGCLLSFSAGMIAMWKMLKGYIG